MLKAEFTISAKNKTQRAFDEVEHSFSKMERAVSALKYIAVGAIFAEFGKSVIETEIHLQSMTYTLEAATGSMAGARREMQFLFKTADRLGLSIDATGQYFARMEAIATASGFSLKEFHREFVAISSGMRVLHLDARHTKFAWLALQEIMAQGTVKMRHLTRQLSIDFPTALQAAALGMHKTTGQLLAMAHAGTLMSHTFLAGLGKGITELYGSEISGAANALQADLTRVSNAFVEAVHASDQTGAFDTFGAAMNRLAAVIKSPSFIGAMSTLIDGLAKIARWGAGAVSAIDRLTNAAVGFYEKTQLVGFGGKAANTLSAQLRQDLHDYMQLRKLAAEPHFTPMSKWNGHKVFLSPAQNARAHELLVQIRNLRRIQREGPEAVSRFNYLLQHQGAHTTDTHRHHVQQMTSRQEAAMKGLVALADQMDKHVASHKSPQQRAAEALHQFKHGSALWQEANAVAQRIRHDSAILASQKKITAEHKQTEAEHRKQQETQKKQESALRRLALHWKDVLDPTRKYRLELVQLNKAYLAGYLDQKQYTKASGKVDKQIVDLKKKAQVAKSIMSQVQIQAARNMESIFATYLADPFKAGLRGMIASFADTMRKMVAQWLAAQVLMRAGKALGGGFGSFLTQAASYGGGKAVGGAVNSGQVYTVGEQGPELFMPSTSGTIIPNHALKQGGHHVTVNIDARGAGPDEVGKLLQISGDLRHQIHNDIRFKDRYGYLPAT